MMTDGEIREALEKGWIKIDPEPADSDIQPCSIDVHLGNVFGLIPFINRRNFVRLSEKSEVEYRTSNELVLGPNEFVLAQLKERVTLDNQTVARIEGKSSVGRKGISIHATAGFVDAGWDGILTLELHNASGVNVLLRAGDPIGQIAFDRLAVPVQRPYGSKELGSHYQGADRVQGAENLKV
jgi:dCTP deaminase